MLWLLFLLLSCFFLVCFDRSELWPRFPSCLVLFSCILIHICFDSCSYYCDALFLSVLIQVSSGPSFQHFLGFISYILTHTCCDSCFYYEMSCSYLFQSKCALAQTSRSDMVLLSYTCWSMQYKFVFLTLTRPYTDSYWSVSISDNSFLPWPASINLCWYAQSVWVMSNHLYTHADICSILALLWLNFIYFSPWWWILLLLTPPWSISVHSSVIYDLGTLYLSNLMILVPPWPYLCLCSFAMLIWTPIWNILSKLN